MYQTTIHTVAQTGESLAELAYRQLEEMIVTLKLEPGSIVNERALTDITGMGRTPVREAVQKLAWEGLMEIRPRSGIAIAPLNLQDFGKILDTREGVERVLARDAARYGAALHHKRLREASDAMSTALASDDVGRFLMADKIFDTVLGQAAENPFAARLASPLQTHSRRFWFRLQRPGSLQQSGGAHKALIDAIIAGAPDRASEEATKLIDHLRTLAP
ncbi:GntR family transcriptional regulator [Phyllobacterium bourgognense]|uniref:GntR family transcriptional regulator n=1 Tax=Phyllobacterium bourgognense TaxID=314236 RepID=A0A368YJG1_9HYPH|nr:GntR family transcriptional regulator [Phyllobacterium bourgognense]RCW80372.1 GntR family transcriptional regulator [Phyllobacterium bourgognense]